MKPRELVGTAIVPGGEELRLFRRGGDFMIVLGGNELMSSRMSGSEEALAVMTCERLRNSAAPRVLIGGYGMGFTLRAALTRRGNDQLYSRAGLASAKRALKPGGVLAVWSAYPDPAFTRRLNESGFAVDQVEVRARSNGKGPRHTIWFARRS